MFKIQKFTKDQRKFISAIHEKFAILTAENLSNYLGLSARLHVYSIKKMAYKKYINSVHEKTSLAVINMNPLNSNFIIEIDHVVTFAIINYLCGGNTYSNVLHELTDIETSLMKGIYKRILENMNEIWNYVPNIKTFLQKIITNPIFVQIIPPKEDVIVINIKTTIGYVIGNINICIPYFVFEEIIKNSNGIINEKDINLNLFDKINELKSNISELNKNMESKISDTIDEFINLYDENKSILKQNRETELITFLYKAFQNNTEIAIDLFRSFYLKRDELKKAAVLLVSLGSELSIKIFNNLREYEIEMLTFELARMDRIVYKQKISVIKEFYEFYLANEDIPKGGFDYAYLLLKGSVGFQKATDIINRLTLCLQVRPFDFIRRVDPAILINFIQQEHPQIIALILSYLEPKNSAFILEKLSYDVQVDVTKRIAASNETNPEVLREIERILEKKMSSMENFEKNKAGGTECITEILSFVNPVVKKNIIEFINNEDQELAERIKSLI